MKPLLLPIALLLMFIVCLLDHYEKRKLRADRDYYKTLAHSLIRETNSYAFLKEEWKKARDAGYTIGMPGPMPTK